MTVDSECSSCEHPFPFRTQDRVVPKTTANTKGRHRRSSAPESEQTSGREYVQAVQRGFAVIKAFTAENPSLSMADVAQRTGLARAVARGTSLPSPS